MASSRLRKIGGVYKDNDFKKLALQLNNRALLFITMINSNCKECEKLFNFIGRLESGMIEKLPQMVMLYGFNNKKIVEGGRQAENDRKAENSEEKDSKKKTDGKSEKKELGDSRLFSWSRLSSGHGYSIFYSESDIVCFEGDFDHSQYVSNVIENARRFKSSIRTLSDLQAKKNFIDGKKSGIIVNTSGATNPSQVIEVEETIKKFGERIKIPIYFCKGLSQDIELVVRGEIKLKKKGLDFARFIKKVPKTL